MMPAQEWRKRKRGTPQQIGKPFPVMQGPVRQTSADHFKEVLRTKAQPVFKARNPLMDEPDEAELARKEEEKEIERAGKVMAYWRQHPEISREEAEQKALSPSTSDRVSGIIDTTRKISSGLSSFFKRIGIGTQEPEEEKSVYETESEAPPIEQLLEEQ